MAQESLGRASGFSHDGDTAIGNEAAVLVPRPDPDFSALIDGQRNLALGAHARYDNVLSGMSNSGEHYLSLYLDSICKESKAGYPQSAGSGGDIIAPS